MGWVSHYTPARAPFSMCLYHTLSSTCLYHTTSSIVMQLLPEGLSCMPPTGVSALHQQQQRHRAQGRADQLDAGSKQLMHERPGAT